MHSNEVVLGFMRVYEDADRAWKAADNTYTALLVAEYGASKSGDARYLFKHANPAVQAAARRYVACSDAWHKALTEWREARKAAGQA